MQAFSVDAPFVTTKLVHASADETNQRKEKKKTIAVRGTMRLSFNRFIFIYFEGVEPLIVNEPPANYNSRQKLENKLSRNSNFPYCRRQ